MDIPDGEYSINCYIGRGIIEGNSVTKKVFFRAFNNEFMVYAGENIIELELEAMPTYYLPMAILNLPGRYDSRVISSGQCMLTDSDGQKHEMTTPAGSGQGIWNIGETNQMLCNGISLPLEAEIVSFSIVDSDGVKRSMKLEYDAFKMLADESSEFTFPETTNLTVEASADLRTPPTLNLVTTSDGYMNATFSPGNFDFSQGVWTYNADGGTVAEGCDVMLLNKSGGYTVSDGATVVDQMSFSLGYFCIGAGDISLLPCYDLRVVLDGRTLMSVGDGWAVPAFQYPVDENGKKLPSLKVSMSPNGGTSFTFSEGDYVCIDGGWFTEAHYCRYFDTSYVVHYLVDGVWNDVTIGLDQKVETQGRPTAVKMSFIGHYRGERDYVYYDEVPFDNSVFVVMSNGAELQYQDRSWIVPAI